MGKARLSYEEFETVLTEIETVINSRPLTYLYEDCDEALTPSHLVLGRRLLSPIKNNGVVEHNHDLLNNRYKYLQTIIEHYWKRFSHEYLFELHEHHLYSHKKNYDEFCKLLLGDVVLIKEDSLNRNNWRKGKVEKLIYGNDNKCRGALLKVCDAEGKTTYIQRPIQRIIPLKVQKELVSDNSDSVTNINSNNDCSNGNYEVSRNNDSNCEIELLDSIDHSTKSEKRIRLPPQRFEISW